MTLSQSVLLVARENERVVFVRLYLELSPKSLCSCTSFRFMNHESLLLDFGYFVMTDRLLDVMIFLDLSRVRG